MKNILFSLLLLIAFFDVRSQSEISIGITPAVTWNLNCPVKNSELNDFEIYSNYPDFKTGINIIYERLTTSIIFGINYQWSKYGWKHTYYRASKMSSVYNLEETILSTETISIDLMLSKFVTSIFRNKAQLYVDGGGGYSWINHTQLSGHSKISIHNASFTQIMTYNQADVGSVVNSPFIGLGVSVKAFIKNVGKIRYGAHYNYYLNALPEMNVDLEINNEQFTSRFKTNHSYFELFITYYFLNFKKRRKRDSFHIINYR